MKKLLLASAVAALSLSSAHAAPTVYGKAFLTLDAASENTTSTNVAEMVYETKDVPPVTTTKRPNRQLTSNPSGLNSNGSRVGFRGSEVINSDMDFQYQLEYGVNVVDSNKAQFNARDSFVGVAHKQLGAVRVGHLSSVDVDYANVLTGYVLGGAGILASYDGNRYNNAIVYEAPKVSDIQLSALYGKDDIDGRKNIVVAANYEPDNQPIKVGASYANAQKSWRVSGSYQLTPKTTLGALYQRTNYKANNENAISVSTTYDFSDKLSPYAQIDYVDNRQGLASDGDKRIAVGTRYKFKGNLIGHLYGAMSDTSKFKETDERKDGIGKLETRLDRQKGFGVGGGIEYKF